MAGLQMDRGGDKEEGTKCRRVSESVKGCVLRSSCTSMQSYEPHEPPELWRVDVLPTHESTCRTTINTKHQTQIPFQTIELQVSR